VRRRGARADEDNDGRVARLGDAIARHPREFVGLLMATVATGWIFSNALFLQKGPHPAPIFTAHPLRHQSVPLAPARPRPPSVAAADTTEGKRVHLVADIQRELGKRGFYDGVIDGLWGAKTDAAVRDFVQASGIKLAPEANDALMQAILASHVRRASEPVRRNDPIAALIAPSQRVLAVQRALADYAYGPLALSGVYDMETRAAIERFQRARGLPIDGQISERLVRELSSLIGRPLE
jgi:peptidoglycan hydrolase-like protein with peptidoglycan-binding domain